MDENKLLEIIKWEELDFSEEIRWTTITDIIDETTNWNRDWYIEWLTSYAWEGTMDLYLSYFDSDLNAIILIDSLEDWIYFKDEQELCDYILWLDVVYKNFKQKILDFYKEE